ncbi:MAG: hypothetical protein IT290_10820 [Deltaproteobacteria bacterium]|nr:hypothetical protein [Deltaproteobacteria bacterium]
MLLTAVLLGLVSSLVVPGGNPGRRFLAEWIIRFVILTAVGYTYVYFELPAFGNPLWDLGGIAVILSVMNACAAWYFSEADEVRLGRATLAPALILACWLFTTLVGSPWISARNLAGVIDRYGTVEEVDWEKTVRSIDPDHIVMVSHEQASYRGGTTLNQGNAGVGSRFEVAGYAKQKVGGSLQLLSSGLRMPAVMR